ncbi:MAG TPA: hypothetical protein ACQGQX_01025, partial [Xylella taiwanensis]
CRVEYVYRRSLCCSNSGVMGFAYFGAVRSIGCDGCATGLVIGVQVESVLPAPIQVSRYDVKRYI